MEVVSGLRSEPRIPRLRSGCEAHSTVMFGNTSNVSILHAFISFVTQTDHVRYIKSRRLSIYLFNLLCVNILSLFTFRILILLMLNDNAKPGISILHNFENWKVQRATN
jgi:hypothetical protein